MQDYLWGNNNGSLDIVKVHLEGVNKIVDAQGDSLQLKSTFIAQ